MPQHSPETSLLIDMVARLTFHWGETHGIDHAWTGHGFRVQCICDEAGDGPDTYRIEAEGKGEVFHVVVGDGCQAHQLSIAPGPWIAKFLALDAPRMPGYSADFTILAEIRRREQEAGLVSTAGRATFNGTRRHPRQLTCKDTAK